MWPSAPQAESPAWGELATSVSGFSIVACLIANTLALSMLSALFAASAELVATIHFAGEHGSRDSLAASQPVSRLGARNGAHARNGGNRRRPRLHHRSGERLLLLAHCQSL